MAFQSPPSSLATPLSFSAHHAPGRNAHVFQPPKSPASAVTTPSFATANDYFSTGSRKRSRPASSRGAQVRQSLSATPSWVQCPTPSDASYQSAVGSSAYGQSSVLVNERYTLAGGLDTPGLQATADMEQMQLGSSNDGRRWRGDASGHARNAGAMVSGPLMRERNGIARMPSFQNGEATKSWTGLAFNLVGKVFSFGSNVVRGFYAGGGKGYDMRLSLDGTLWNCQEGCATPLPGSWQENEFLGDFEQDNPQPASRPPNKRRQTDRDTWVMVGTPDLPDSPRRKASSTSVPRSNLAMRPPASRASSRRSLAPLPRRQSSQTTYTVTQSGSPAHLPALPLSPERRASFAPMRANSRPSSSSSSPGNAYISPEAERYVKRRVKQEKQADAAMTDMSRKLADLIRQGQEALGTKFSVEGPGAGEEADGGYVDEEW
ncbi:hypothetical protein LTR85_012185 [Meristemomyces frigidus]|nr:hypothetical protein LTR85_012185 [Meristemomyces frigidus]